MRNKLFGTLFGAWLLLGLVDGTLAQVQAPLPTATPDAAGRIFVRVQPNDSLWAIAARAGLSLNELLALNELSEDAIIQPGDLLLIGYGEPPATPTVPPLPTATLPPPTPRPTAVPLRTAICLTAYDDLDQDGVFDVGESLRAAVAFTIFDTTAVMANYVTDGFSEPYCVEGLAGGEYHITRSVTPQEVLTTDGEWAISLAAGELAHLDFGSYVAQPPTATVVRPAARPAATAMPPPTEPASPPVAPRNTVVLLASGLATMLIFVAVLFLLIWRRLRRMQTTTTVVVDENG